MLCVRDSQTEIERPKEASEAPIPRIGRIHQEEQTNPSMKWQINIRKHSNKIRIWKKEDLKNNETRQNNKSKVTIIPKYYAKIYYRSECRKPEEYEVKTGKESKRHTT